MTGAISFSGVSLEEARAERRVFLRTLAILLGVDESWVRVAIRRARRSRRRVDASYAPTTAPTRKMPTPAPSLVPTATAASEPTTADGGSLAPTAARRRVVDYNASVPSISEAEAVEAVVETTTPADVDEAVDAAATEVAAETGETSTIVESIATEEVSAVEIVAAPPGTPGDDDPPTLGLSEADDGASDGGGGGGSGGGGGGGADAAAAGGAAGAVVLLLALGTGLCVYRRRGSKAGGGRGRRRARSVNSWPCQTSASARARSRGRRGVAAAPGSAGRRRRALHRRDQEENYRRPSATPTAPLRAAGVATLGLRKAVRKLLRAEPPAPRRADEPPPPPPPPPPLPPPPPARPGSWGGLRRGGPEGARPNLRLYRLVLGTGVVR